MSFLENVNIIKNEQDTNVSPEKAIDIYNNKNRLEFSPKFYFGSPEIYDEELKRIETKEISQDIDTYKGLGSVLANANLYEMAKKERENIKAQEDAILQKSRERQYELSSWWNKTYEQYKKSRLSIEISGLEKELYENTNLTESEIAEKQNKIYDLRKQINEIPVDDGIVSALGGIIGSGVESAPYVIGGAIAGSTIGGPVGAATGGLISAYGAWKTSQKASFSEVKSLVEELAPDVDSQTQKEYIDTIQNSLAVVESLGSLVGLPVIGRSLVSSIIKQYGIKQAQQIFTNKSFQAVLLKSFTQVALSSVGEATEEVLQSSIMENIKPMIEQGADLTTAESLKEGYIGVAETVKNIVTGQATEYDLEQAKTFLNVWAASAILGGLGKGGEASIQKIQEISTNKAKAQANLKKTQDFKKARDNNKLKVESPEADKAILKSIVEANKLDGYIYLNQSVVEDLINESSNSEVYANAVNGLNLVEALRNSVDGTVAIEFDKAVDVIFDGDGALYQELENHIMWSPDSMPQAMFDIYTDALAGGIEDADKQFIDEITAKLEPTSTPSRARGDALLAYYIADALSRADPRKTREQYGRELVDSVSVGDIKSVDELFVKDIEKPQTSIQKVVRKAKKAVGKVKDIVKESKVDNIAKEYAKMLGQDVSDFHNKFAQAIVNKDFYLLSQLILSGRGMNEKSKKMFEKTTGVKLPSTIKGKEKTLVEWAGLNYDEYIANKQTSELEEKQRREQEEKEQRFNQYVKELENNIVTFENERMSEKDMIDRLVNRGATLSEKKVGINNIYRLTETNGSYLEFKKKSQKEYIDSLFQATEEDLAHLFGEEKVEPQVEIEDIEDHNFEILKRIAEDVATELDIEFGDNGLFMDLSMLIQEERPESMRSAILGALPENVGDAINYEYENIRSKLEELGQRMFWKPGRVEDYAKLAYEEYINRVFDRYNRSTEIFYTTKLFQDLAAENTRLDDLYPEYQGETININGVEKTVYNSNGDRIAKSKEALQNFYKWFGDSKVVDEQGRPLVVYHGTEYKFDIFRQGTAQGWGYGSYFTDNIEDAEEFGGNIYSVYLKIENPYTDIYALKDTPTVKKYGEDVVNEDGPLIGKAIREAGFDGIMAYMSNNINGFELVAFNPNQIKSTSNRGTYSLSEDSILKQDLDSIQGEFDVQTLAIRLSKHRNPTTFAHELCHYFTRKLEIAYKDGVLQDYWLKRYRDVMKFAGAKYNKQTKEYYFSTEEDWRKGNEKIANAFTEYLLQGKAPIKQLQPFFQKLKGWFKTVYETIKNFPRVKLSKPIIRVFDSIFAKEIEVETLMRAERLGTFERPDNVTDTQWEEYLTSKETARGASTSASIKAMEELAKKRGEESYQEQKAKFFTEELRELQQNPQHIARDIVGQLKINKATIDSLTTDVKLNSKFLTENGGLDARMVMEQYGFSSITEMVDFINNTNNTQTIAEQIATEKADAWVVEQYPELLDISAENAVRNIALIKTQVYESMMLQGIPLERFNMYYDEMILSTEKIIQGMKMNEVMNMTRWQNRMLNLNEKLITAQRKGDNKTAGKLRWRSAILNYVMLRSKAITGGYKRFDKKFDRYKYTPTKNQVKRIEGKVWDIIHSVLYNFGFTQRQPLDTTNVAQRITEYINDLQSKNFNVLDLTKEQAYFLTNPNATRPQDLKVEDFYAIDGSLRMLESASKKNMKYIQDEKIIEFDEDVSDIINHYEEKGISKWNKEDWGKNMVLGHWGMKETLLSRILPERIFLKYVSPFMDGLVNAAKFIDNKGKEIIEIIKPIMQKRKQEYTINGRVFTYEELGVIMANMGNEHNIDCIAKTYGVTTQEIIDIADKAPKELRDIAQALWDMFEENAKLFKETVDRITGIPLKMVEAKPITFSDGQELRGGYYPANRKANTEAKDFLDETSLKSDEMFPMYSFTKQRTQLAHGDLDTTFKTLESWLYKMAMTIEVAESYNNLSKIAHSSRIVEVMGEGAKDEITNWMSQATTPEKVSKCVATFDALASVGILGWNPIKAVVQMTGIIPAMKEIGVVRCLTELVKIISNPYNLLTIIRQAKGLSNYMNQRFSSPEMHLADVRRMSWLDGGKTQKGLEWVSHIGMAFVTYGDCIASVSSWRAMYNKALSEGKTEAEATSLADSVVRRVQGDTSAGSRPPLLQGDKRFFNKFASYFIGINSMIASDIFAKRRVSAIAMFAMAGILAPTIEVLLSYVYEWETADEEKRKKWRKKGINSAEDYLQDKIKSQMSTSVGSSIVPAYGVGFAVGQYLNIGKVYPADVIGLTNLRELATVPVDVLRQDYEKGFKKTITGLTPIGEDEYKRMLEKLSRR